MAKGKKGKKETKVERTYVEEPAGQVSRRIVEIDDSVEVETEATSEDELVLQGIPASTATIVSDDPPEEGEVEEEVEEEEAEEETETEEEEVETDNLILGKFKTQEELETAYTELNGSFTRTNQEKANEKKFYEDLLKTTTGQPEVKVDEKFAENFYEELMENPTEATKNLVSQITQQVRGDLETEKRVSQAERQEGEKRKTIAWLNKNYPDVVNNQRNSAIVDGLAMAAPEEFRGSYQSMYEYAMKEFEGFAEGVGKKIAPRIKEEVDEMNEMKRKAKINSAGTVSQSSKIYSSAEIRKLMQTNPAEYKRKEKILMKAYAEGRVKR